MAVPSDNLVLFRIEQRISNIDRGTYWDANVTETNG
jgi:hypothetical protein